MCKDIHEGLVAFVNELLRIYTSIYAQQVSLGYHVSLQRLSASGIKFTTSLIWNTEKYKIKASDFNQASIPAKFWLGGVRSSGNIVFL